jgi:hypothetical protein
MGPGLVRFEKFSAQIDAWKAGVSQEIIDAVRKETGENRVNSTFALKKLFEEVRSQGGELRPILQVGFIEYHRNANSRELLFTIAIYVPLAEKIVSALIYVSGGNVAHPQKSEDSANSEQIDAPSESKKEDADTQIVIKPFSKSDAIQNGQTLSHPSHSEGDSEEQTIKSWFDNGVRLISEDEFMKKCADAMIVFNGPAAKNVCGHNGINGGHWYFLKEWRNENLWYEQALEEAVKEIRDFLIDRRNQGRSTERFIVDNLIDEEDLTKKYGGFIRRESLFQEDGSKYTNNDRRLKRLERFNIIHKGMDDDGCHRYSLGE